MFLSDDAPACCRALATRGYAKDLEVLGYVALA